MINYNFAIYRNSNGSNKETLHVEIGKVVAYEFKEIMSNK